MDFLEHLIPDEPFFPYDRQIAPRYSAELPKVVRNWCFVSITVNVATLTNRNPHTAQSRPDYPFSDFHFDSAAKHPLLLARAD